VTTPALAVAAGPVVDAHAHVIVPGLGAEVRWDERGQVVELDAKAIRSAVREFVDLPRILEEQDRAGVDLVLLCPWVSLLGRDPARQNEALAAMVGPRVAGLGTVDPRRPAELVELVEDGRLSGVELAASVDGDYLGHDRFRDFWAAAEETRALVFVHPTTRGFGIRALDDYYLWNAIGNPLETTVTAAHLVMAGILEEHPRLRVLLAHGGGAILALRGRLRHAHSFQRDARSRLGESPVDSLKLFYLDTVTHDADLLRAAIEFSGPGRVLLGSDYPFDMGLERPAEPVRALELAGDAEAKVLGGNALQLLGREAGA
jgi:aminocarboxymuconate-semialdehyde decarboxylase